MGQGEGRSIRGYGPGTAETTPFWSTFFPMFERNKALDLIERAMDTDPFCPVCYAPTVINDEDGVIVLRCSTVTEAHGFFARMGATLLPHIRREVVDLRAGIAA
jgi:hypothetical protein